jgi:hypothetical protein
MDVIDRYFRTLRILLPKDQRDDIVRELSEEVQSHVAERERALGRLLSAGERGELIGQYGHPLLTAARYRPERHLIGPVVFPYYWIVLKIALVLVALGHVLGATVLVADGTSAAEIGHVVDDAIATALKVGAWITVLGAAAEFWLTRSRVLETWHPTAASALPGHMEHTVASALASAVPGPQRPASRSRLAGTREPSVSRLVIGVVVGAWWLAGLRFPYLFFGSGAAHIEWGPAIDRLYPVLVVAQLTMLAEQVVHYARPESTAVFRLTRVVWLIAGLVLAYLVATSDHQWMVWNADSSARADTIVMRLAGRDISLLEFVNDIWSVVFVGVAAASVLAFLRAVSRRIRGGPMTAPA